MPTTDCPESNGTSYDSLFSTGSSGGVPTGAGNSLSLERFCDLDVTNNLGENLAEAVVYTLADCIELCASYNFWRNCGNCTVAAYRVTNAASPGNFWVSTGSGAGKVTLAQSPGLSLALSPALFSSS